MEGYDAKFDPPLDKRLECPICLLAQREPMQTPCGHRFCSMCILRALRETGPRCPVDNTRVCNHQLFKDNFAKREVLSLNVKCSAAECGCPWHGELRSLEVHMGMCELVHMDCPNSCGHFCQRKNLAPHLVMCSNKPEQCPHCSIHFCRNRMQEHSPNCSTIMVPESVHSNLIKANEILKWCGSIKLKVNAACSSVFQQAAGSVFQVSGYLTAKVDSQESFLFTGNWTSCCTVMPLNAPSAKIFWRTLHGREVQSKSFGFGLLANDNKANLFFRILKKKLVDMSAVLGLRLKSGRSRNDLTIIYFYWSEPKRRLMACVAELKSHLVKQLQNRLHVLHNPQRGRTSSSDPQLSRSQSHTRSQSRSGESRILTRLGERPHYQTYHQFPIPPPAAPDTYHAPPIPSHPSTGHILHPQLHAAAHPAAMALLAPAPPGSQPHHHHHLQATLPSHHLHDSSQPPPMGHHRFLSWQMSQSLNGYPWRVQTGNVPYFSFPSTPPSFLPSNPLPYTFAPAPPFSISQIAQVPSSGVPVPPYAGIAVQGAVVDSMVPGPSGASFPVAAISSLSDVPSEHLHSVPPGAVAVTITSAGAVPGQPAGATVVIQQSVMPPSHDMASQDMAVLHAIGATPPHYQVPPIPTIIAADGGQSLIGPSVPPGEGVALGRYHVTPHLVAPPHHHHNLMGMSLDNSVTYSDSLQGHGARMLPRELADGMHQHGGASSSHFEAEGNGSNLGRVLGGAGAIRPLNDGAGPSRSMDSDSASDNDSMDSNSPSRNFASLIYGIHRYPNYDNDSDDSSEAPIELDSSDSMLHVGDMSADSQMSSDVDDSSSPSSVSDIQSPTDPSTVHHISGHTATVVISPAPSPGSVPNSAINLSLNTTLYSSSDEGSPITASSADESGTLTLPVLINITDSDSSRVTPHPTSVIDLTTTSPTQTDSPGVSEINPSLPSSSNVGVHIAGQMASSSYDDVITVSRTHDPATNQRSVESGVYMTVQQNAQAEGQLSHRDNGGRYGGPVMVPRQIPRDGTATEVVAGRYGGQVLVQRHAEGEGMAEEGPVQLVAGHYVGPMPRRTLRDGQETQSSSQHYSGDPIPVVRAQARELAAMSDGPDVVRLNSRLYAGRVPVVQGQMRQEGREGAMAEGQEVQIVNHSMVQPHNRTPQLYAPGHGNLVQPRPLQGYHPRDPAQHYSTHLPPGSGTLESNPAVRVLRWQPALSQPQHLTGELLSSSHRAAAAAAVPLPSSGFPSHQRQGVESVNNQTGQGNFWETVMPSLDMSLQGSGVVSRDPLQ